MFPFQTEKTEFKMEQSTMKTADDVLTSKVAIHKGRKLGRGAVESGLTHECGVFGVVGAGKWPSSVSLKYKIFKLFT